MRMIFCNIQLFSNDQMVYVLDEDGKQIHAKKMDIEDLREGVCALAHQFDTNQVRISGAQVYTMAWAEEIQSTYALKYGKNNLEVEIV